MASSKQKAKVNVAKQSKMVAYESSNIPEVKILKCIGFQKFRYCGENRPGKKYQDKDFLQLALVHLSGKNVKIQIVCFEAEKHDTIHPNGLVGRDCESGVYTKTYPISKSTQIIRIPYLRTERILTKKTKEEGGRTIMGVFKERAHLLPSPFKEWCEAQSLENRKYDTTRVCFGVIATVEDGGFPPLFCLSNTVQNASEKTMLKIHKLSTEYVSAQEGGEVDIFTTEDGPPITAGKCTLKVIRETDDEIWESEETSPTQAQILYKRVVTYQVPAFAPNPAIDSPVRAAIQLSCRQSGQICVIPFHYEPGADSARRLATMHSNKPLRKRPYIPGSMDESLNGTNSIKMRVKEKVQQRQNQGDQQQGASSSSAAAAASSAQLSTVAGGSGSAQLSTVAGGGGSLADSGGSAQPQDALPLHQQEDIVLAKDVLTGQLVYLRSPQSVDDMVMFLEPSPTTTQPLPPSEGSTSATILASSSSSAAEPSYHLMEAAPRVSAAQQAGNSRKRFVSPWIVEELNTPLVNGDVSMSSAGMVARDAGRVVAVAPMKKEPADMGPPILPVSSREVTIVSEGTLGAMNLTSMSLLSNNLTSLTSLGSWFNAGMLNEDALLSASVFEMVQPYMEKAEK